MISDGIDRYYGIRDTQDPYVSEAIEQAQKAGIVVFAIYDPGAGHFGHSYWWNYWGQLYLSEVTGRSGGESYYIGFNGPAVNFVPYFDNVTHRLGNQYLLTFLSTCITCEALDDCFLAWVVGNQFLSARDLEISEIESGGNCATYQRVVSSRIRIGSEPRACFDYVLQALAAKDIRPEHDVIARSVRLEFNYRERSSQVEMPDFVGSDAMQPRHRTRREQVIDGSAVVAVCVETWR